MSRLRTRMAISYVLVSLVIALGLLTVFIAFGLYIVTRSPVLPHLLLGIINQSAETYALQAALWAEGTAIDPGTTFEPGRPTSLGPYQEDSVEELAFLSIDVPYIEPGSPPSPWQVFALVVGPDEQVIASSYPDAYPAAVNIEQILPEDAALIRSALSGEPEYVMRENAQGRLVSIARPVWNQDRQPIGAVYIQAPAGGRLDIPLLPQVASIVIPSGMLLLCIMLPIGALFGALTTRGLVRRIERLASATAQFTGGDYSQRVPIGRTDEVGQLEQQFNQMAEQLVDSFEQRRALAEQSARREERARIEQEMSSAYYIQKSLLPKEIPAIPGWQIEPFYRPARHVGGDLYDFLALPEGKIGIVIGDANGKGMPAALIMSTTSAMLRAAAPGEVSPGRVLTQVNRLLHLYIPPSTFVTCFYAILDPENGRLAFANAGHNLPYLRRGGEVSELRAAGMPLGLMPEQDYPEQEIDLVEGDSIVFHSDGLVEAHNASGEMFGSQRMMHLMQDYAKGADVIRLLLKELDDFTGPEWEQEDDITLIVLKVGRDMPATPKIGELGPNEENGE